MVTDTPASPDVTNLFRLPGISEACQQPPPSIPKTVPERSFQSWDRYGYVLVLRYIFLRKSKSLRITGRDPVLDGVINLLQSMDDI